MPGPRSPARLLASNLFLTSLWLLLGLACARARAEQPFGIDMLMRRLAAVPARTATFQEQKTVAALSAPIEDSGTLAYTRPSSLEKHTLRPEEEILRVDGERLTLSRPARHETRTLDLTDQPEIGALVDTVRGTLSGDLPVLQAHYSVGLEGTLAAWRLTLVPIDGRVARFLRVVRIDGSGNTLRTIETVQANNDTTRMTVTAAP